MVLGFLENLMFYFGFLIFILPYFYLYAKSVEEVCMIRKIKTKYLTEGDWLYSDIIIEGKKIKSNWEGLSKRQLDLIQKKCKKKILIKYGIPFTPSFLLGYIVLLILYWSFRFWYLI